MSADTLVEKAAELVRDWQYPRRVKLGKSFESKDIEAVMNDLRALDSISSRPIILEINSDGGSIIPAIKLYRLIDQGLRSSVYAVVAGSCFSSAFFILQACQMRFAYSTAHLGMHQNYINVWVQITADTDPLVIKGMVEHEVKERIKIRDIIVSTLSKKWRRGKEETLAFIRAEKLLSTDDAMNLGLIDKIL